MAISDIADLQSSGSLQTMLDNSVEISAELKSLLDHLRESRTFLETMLQVGSAVSEVCSLFHIRRVGWRF
jgi:hypothetical protein